MRFRAALSRVLLLGTLFAAGSVFAQDGSGTITGFVSDPTGALIPGANISARRSSNPPDSAVSDERGLYNLQLPPGEYRLEASAPGFQTFGPITIRILPGKTLKHDIRLELGLVSQKVRVSESSIPDSEPDNNASAITLTGSSLESLSDDPEDLTDDLNALAGPAAGPDGGELYVDGFSGGKLPPKSSIREVRLNQNPFSAEYDRIGFSRIEILTKPARQSSTAKEGSTSGTLGFMLVIHSQRRSQIFSARSSKEL